MSTASNCDCVARMNENLKPHGLRLASCFSIGTGTAQHRPVLISTEKLADAGRRKTSPPLVIASFCPFCGKRFAEPNAETKEPVATEVAP